VRDWAGLGGPLIHVPDPLGTSTLVDALAAALAPRFRVFSITPRVDAPYQVHVLDLEGALGQFGFERIVLVAEGLGSISALLLAAWYPLRVGALSLVDPVLNAPEGETLFARSLRDCPMVRPPVECPVVELAGRSPTLVGHLQQLLDNHPVP
jgi:pimeloyl-ACP methyl ester carboxylesterase